MKRLWFLSKDLPVSHTMSSNSLCVALKTVQFSRESWFFLGFFFPLLTIVSDKILHDLHFWLFSVSTVAGFHLRFLQNKSLKVESDSRGRAVS